MSKTQKKSTPLVKRQATGASVAGRNDGLVLRQRFLEKYALSENGVDQSLIAEDLGVDIGTIETWLRSDAAFRSQYEALNQRRVERVHEIFCEGIESVARNMVEQARTGHRNSVRAATLIFETVGAKAAAAALVSVTNNTMVVRSRGDLAEAKTKFNELQAILDDA